MYIQQISRHQNSFKPLTNQSTSSTPSSTTTSGSRSTWRKFTSESPCFNCFEETYLEAICDILESSEILFGGDYEKKLELLNKAWDLCENAPSDASASELLSAKIEIIHLREEVYLHFGRIEDAIRDRLVYIDLFPIALEAMFREFAQMFPSETFDVEQEIRKIKESPEFDMMRGALHLALGEMEWGNAELQKGASKGSLMCHFMLKARGIEPNLSPFSRLSVEDGFAQLDSILRPYIAYGDYEGALNALNAPSIQSDINAPTYRALLLAILGRWEEAAVAADETSRLTTNFSWPNTNIQGDLIRAIILNKAGRQEEAEAEAAKFGSQNVEDLLSKMLYPLFI